MSAQSEPWFAYAAGRTPNSTSIELLRLDPESGLIEDRLPFVAELENPSFMTIDQQGLLLYAISEVEEGSLHSFQVRADGTLTPQSSTPTGGSFPAHMSLHPTGPFAFVAHYGSGNIRVISLQSDATMIPLDSREGSGPLGSTTPAEAPPGSFANSGHDAPHAHFVISSPDGRFVLHTDLGRDSIFVWSFDPNTGSISESPVASFRASDGAGARHLAFHPTKSVVYLITEESSQLYTLSFDPQSGKLSQLQKTSTLPDGFMGTNYASDVRVSPSGNFVLAANRLHDSIAVFRVEVEGTLSLLSHTHTQGSYIRTINLSPNGRLVYSANQNADNYGLFRFDGDSGDLSSSGYFIDKGTPQIIAFCNQP